jgi:two-component system NtrC family sensor kinase
VISLNEKLPEMTDMLRTSLRGDIELLIQFQGTVWPIEADLAEFELALLNIAVNARDAMPNGGALTIAARNVNLSHVPGTELTGCSSSGNLRLIRCFEKRGSGSSVVKD